MKEIGCTTFFFPAVAIVLPHSVSHFFTGSLLTFSQFNCPCNCASRSCILHYNERPKVLVTLNRIYCMTKLSTFTESTALERMERIIGGDREGLRAGIGNWKGVKVSKNLETLSLMCDTFCQCRDTMCRVQKLLLTRVCFRHFCGSLRGASLISQKNASLNLVDFHGSSYTSTLNILHSKWIIPEKVRKKISKH